MKENIQTYRIQLSRLLLKNFRGLRETGISFDDQLTVLIGANGAGKTTVLDGLAYFLKYLESLITGLGYNFNATGLKDLDVNIHAKQAELGLEMTLNDALHNLHIEINRDSFEIPVSSMQAGDDSIYDLQTEVYEGLGKGQRMHLPVLAYYSANSLTIRPDDIAGNEAVENEYRGIYNAYKNGLSAGGFRFQDFFRWFDLQQKIGLQKGNNDKLQAVRIAISTILSEDGSAYGDLCVDWNETGDILELPKGEDRLNVLMLSSGEKMLLALVADLARRLAVASPHSSSPLNEGTGIVLIDEIDVHLHPSWQRKVVPKLLEIFPNVQFVVTTHSPILLGGVPSKHIRVLHEQKPYSVTETYGREIDDILEIIMHVDAGEYTSEIRNISRLIAQNELEQAEAELIKMVREIDAKGDRGEEHPDVLRMKSVITRKKVLSR